MSEEKCPQCHGFRGVPKILYDDQENPRECDNAFHTEPPPVIEMPKPEDRPEPPPPVPQPFQKPKCPACGSEGQMKSTMVKFGPAIDVLVVYCGNQDCRIYLGFVQVFPMTAMVPPPAGMPH